jgi:Bacterial aa3 type cytochrome c oxidase subunit IV
LTLPIPRENGTIGLPNDPIGSAALLRLPVCGNCSPELKNSLGTEMADHSEVAYTTADGNDYVAHEQTYEGFIKLVKYGTGAVILLLILMAIFLV